MANQRWNLVLCALLWFTTVAWAEPYVSADGRFSADLSSSTVCSTSQSESPVGAVVTTVYLDRQPGRFLTVSYTDLPKLALLAGRDRIFDEARDGMLQQCSGSQSSWQRLDSQTRRLLYTSPGHRGETIFRLEKFRLYVIDVRSELAVEPQMDAQFLRSFKIISPPAASAPAPKEP
ncbi:hypothetical protein JST97_27725 [bacterium]|nr:hypothetical protein [bacterium]